MSYRDELMTKAQRVFEGLKQRRARVRVPENIALAESDARDLMQAMRLLIDDAICDGDSALDYHDCIQRAREVEDQARELIAD